MHFLFCFVVVVLLGFFVFLFLIGVFHSLRSLRIYLILFCQFGHVSMSLICLSVLLQGAITVELYSMPCASPGCNQLLTYKRAAKKEGIFFLTSSTCVGEEIAWDFVNLVTKSHISFTAFCKEMTRRYKTTARNSRAFLSTKTFIDYFFAWMSAFKIDYTSEVDPFCKHNPPMLACDGTHVGLASKFQSAPHPVIMVDDPGAHAWPSHRRWVISVVLAYRSPVLHRICMVDTG